MRERLIELLLEVDNICDISECVECVTKNCGTYRAADHLIENGLVFATDNNVGGKWIPVTERLPEKQADVLLFFGGKYKNMAVGFWHGEKEMNAVYWCAYTDDGFYTDCDWKPTHWMPLPEPPKEGE